MPEPPGKAYRIRALRRLAFVEYGSIPSDAEVAIEPALSYS